MEELIEKYLKHNLNDNTWELKVESHDIIGSECFVKYSIGEVLQTEAIRINIWDILKYV